MVARSAMRRCLLLQFRGQFVEERRVGLGVHFAAEHLRGAGERERRDILAERVAGARSSRSRPRSGRPSRCARFPGPRGSWPRPPARSSACARCRRPARPSGAPPSRIASEPCRASASSFWPFSPAAMPSAISLRRFSIACMTGGQIHFMQNQTKTIIATVCPISVRLKSIELLPRSAAGAGRLLQLPDERVGEGEEERDADADHRDGVQAAPRR